MDKEKFIPITVEALTEHLKARRGTATKSQFAKWLGASRALVNAWEKGTMWPGPRYLEVLGLEPFYRVVDDSVIKSLQRPEEPPREQKLEAEIRRLKKENQQLRSAASGVDVFPRKAKPAAAR